MLEVRNLNSRYGRLKVLHDVSLSVPSGEIVALIGANGAGKSTFLRSLSGVQPSTSERLEFLGVCIERVPPNERVSRGLVHVPEGRQVFPRLTVEDNLRLGGWTKNKYEVETSISESYGLFPSLQTKRGALAGSLSGGQQQMLAIARGLVSRPKLLILDEPSMGLAPVVIDQVFEIIARLRSQGITILVVEQNAGLALSVADRGYVMETGRIVLAGTGKELRNNPRVKELYLGHA